MHRVTVRRISVLIVDDHAVFADALQARLSAEPDMGPIDVAYGVTEATRRLAAQPPDVMLVDVRLTDGDGVQLTRDVTESAPATRVAMLTAVDSPAVVADALLAGARAWLPKVIHTQRLVDAIRAVHRGDAVVDADVLGAVLTVLRARTADPAPGPLDALTGREREVLDLVALGLAREEIAARLHVSVNTVRTHMRNLSAKLDVHSTLEAAALRNRLPAPS